MKILINCCYGGFGISEEFMEAYADKAFVKEARRRGFFHRDDQDLIAAIEEFGPDEADGPYARLCYSEIPDDADYWDIKEYDGFEEVFYIKDKEFFYAEQMDFGEEE